MTREEYAQLKVLFARALEQPADQRQAWLAQECGDTDVRRHVDALLHAHATAGDFLERAVTVDPATFDPDVFNPDRFDPDGFDPDAVAADAASAITAMPAIAPGDQVGDYVIRRELGRGGMGVVYLADDRRLGRLVALKSIADTADPVRRERLRREARAAATIAHRAIATVYALEEIDGRLYLATEYVAGQTLREALARGPLDESRALHIARDIVAALVAAHDAGVVHRDLKPENIMLPDTGGVKVVDFGIAHRDTEDGPRLTREAAPLGTPAYMAPEQLLGGASVDPRADLYAFGVLLSEMRGRRISFLEPLPASPSPAAASSPLDAIVARCTQVDAALRYASARDLLRDLDGHALERVAVPMPALPDDERRWWWEFHQAAAALTYGMMLIPAWRARVLAGGGLIGKATVILLLAAVIVAVSLRLNLWFTSRFHPAELTWTRAREEPWIRAADWTFAATLIAIALLIGDDRSALAVLCFSVGLGAGVAFLFIEPAARRAAFKD